METEMINETLLPVSASNDLSKDAGSRIIIM